MNPNERRYRHVITSIGGALLIFWGLINVGGLFLGFLPIILTAFSVGEVAAEVISQLVYAAVYLTAFMLPVAFLKWFIRSGGLPYQPMNAAARVSPWFPLFLLAGIVIIWSMSYLNAALVSIFDYSIFSNEVIWKNSAEETTAYQLVLQFIVMCAVPGFCEEFLFRGAILTNCLPFGRSNAILISSLLFSLMHQNAEQILYAFSAGIVLGLVYEKTGSIWNCTVLHILNNFASVFEGVFIGRFPARWSATVATALEGILFLLGALSLVILVVRFFRKDTAFRDGVFGKSIPPADGYAACPVRAKQAFRLFLSPTMIIFLSLCATQIVLLLLMAVFYAR